mgnify:CR=1 FL=1
MNLRPCDYESLWTIASSVSRSGIGLHTGNFSEVRLLPTDIYGVHVSWTGSKDAPIPLQIGQVRESKLCTSLQIGKKKLITVEHLLAAIAGCGLTHIHIQVSGEEIPLLDGSSLEWVKAINEAGFVQIKSSNRRSINLTNPLALNRGESVITAIPAKKFKVIGIIDFPYKAIGRQMLEVELTPELFEREIAPARTFGFKDQIDMLINSGLIKGGALDNALVCDGDQWINPPLRFNDEPIRHKILDLIGDLSLVGFPKAQILVYKGSHGLHTDMALELSKYSTTTE